MRQSIRLVVNTATLLSRMVVTFGIGLYITRLLVYAHGGRIEAESQLGRGSTFRVFLPDRCPLPSQTPAP